MTEVTHRHLAQLRQKLTRYFNMEELRTLCFDMEIDYDDLPGEGRAAKAREFVTYVARNDRIDELVKTCSERRPNVVWDYISPPLPVVNTQPTTILVIDDELDWRKIWKDALRNEGYRIEFATTRDEALDKLGETSFDLVISNLLLRESFSPGWLAESTLILDQIAGQASLPVIIVTGTNERDSEVMYELLDLQREYPQIKRILFKRRCGAPELRRTVRQVIAEQL